MAERTPGTVVDIPDGVAFFCLCSLLGRVKLEAVGLKCRGRSATSIAKQRYGIKGSRAKIVAHLEALVEAQIAGKHA